MLQGSPREREQDALMRAMTDVGRLGQQRNEERRPTWRAAATHGSAAPNTSNKPMVPTAPTSPTTNPLRPLRRHIGQPFGSQRGRSEPVSDDGQRTYRN